MAHLKESIEFVLNVRKNAYELVRMKDTIVYGSAQKPQTTKQNQQNNNWEWWCHVIIDLLISYDKSTSIRIDILSIMNKALYFKAGTVFTPNTPIKQTNLFSGREIQIKSLLRAVSGQGVAWVSYRQRLPTGRD